MNINQRIKEIMAFYILNATGFSQKLGYENNGSISNIIGGRQSKPGFEMIVKILDTFPDVREKWLLKGTGEMLYSQETNNLPTNGAFHVEVFENNYTNEFIKMENGQYLMTMPMAGFDVQAGFLDIYQDAEELQHLSKHSIFVDKPAKGRYVAFKVKGDSMDNGTLDSIQHNSIVTTRELQRVHWGSKLRINIFPYWIIFTTQSRMPLLKQITAHDIETGTITCHSLNDGPEYADFTLNLDTVQALFYVIEVSKPIATENYL